MRPLYIRVKRVVKEKKQIELLFGHGERKHMGTPIWARNEKDQRQAEAKRDAKRPRAGEAKKTKGNFKDIIKMIIGRIADLW